MHTTFVFILTLLALVLQVATKRMDSVDTQRIDTKPAGMVPNVTVSAQWKLVDSTLPYYCGIEGIIHATRSTEPVTHQLFVTAPGKVLIGNLTITNNTAYAGFCMAMGYNKPPQDCASPVKLDLASNEAIAFTLSISRRWWRRYSIVSAAVSTDHRTVDFDKSHNINNGNLSVGTTHEFENALLERKILDATMFAWTSTSGSKCSRQMMRRTLDVEAYLGPDLTTFSCYIGRRNSLICPPPPYYFWKSHGEWRL